MMKKSLLSLGAASMAIAMLVSGCASTDAPSRFEQEKKELDAFLTGSKAVEKIEKTEDKTIDALAENSTILYKRTGGAMREYVEQARGSQAVIEMTYFMHTTPKATEEELKAKAENFIKNTCTETEKKELTPEKLIALGKLQYQYDAYLSLKQDFKDAEALKARMSELKKDAASDTAAKKELDDIQSGEKIFKERWAKTNWDAKVAELKGLLGDSQKIAQNLAVVAQDTSMKIQQKTQDLAGLSKEPAMTQYSADVAALQAKKTFANDERKKEIDAEIAKVAERPEYKPVMDKKAQYEKELAKLKSDSAVLSDGIGGQVNFTGKALPWLIQQYLEMQSYASEE